jgi:tetratricopeptide (TPR) repeat protein
MSIKRLTTSKYVLLLLLLLLLISSPLKSSTQEKNKLLSDRELAFKLLNESKHAEALPLLEKLAKDNAEDMEIIVNLGIVRYTLAQSIKDKKKREEERRLARTELIYAKQLGAKSTLIDSILNDLPEDGSDSYRTTNLSDAEQALQEGEVFFAKGDLDGAIKAYERALQLNPKLYEAALFIGDMYFKKGYPMPSGEEKNRMMAQAGEFFAKAIIINPDRETAYRYWGSALIAINRMDEAREKVIEAYITEPYTRFSPEGLIKWATEKNIRPQHPDIEIPASITISDDNKVQVNINKESLKDDDGSSAWMLYGLIRASWQTTNFAKEYPKEKEYRHSLKEEAAALRGVIESIKVQQKEGKIKNLSPSIAKLIKLEEDGLLEAYILLARPDRGIAQDYAEYRKSQIDKLRRYVREYILR